MIQSLFLRYAGSGPSDAEIAAYLGRLRRLRESGGAIDLVQIYTVARQPADAQVTALGDDQLEQIAAEVRRLGIAAEAYA